MELRIVSVEKPESINFILGQSHFIKTVEDIHETLVESVPGIKFGLAFCEASGKCLVRFSGSDDAMVALATKNALAIGAATFSMVTIGILTGRYLGEKFGRYAEAAGGVVLIVIGINILIEHTR